MKLSIAIPCNRDSSPYFVSSLVGLVQHLTMHKLPTHLNIKPGVSNLAKGRNELVLEAIEAGMTHLLFLDDDMTFPFDLLEHLMRPNLPVVAANCCRKNPKKLEYTAQDFEKKPVKSKGRTGIEQVMRVGTAVMLIDLSIFHILPQPWFEIKYHADTKEIKGEDYHFCDLLVAHNIPIHIDHFISNHIGHIGKFIYDFDSYPDKPEPVEVNDVPVTLIKSA